MRCEAMLNILLFSHKELFRLDNTAAGINYCLIHGVQHMVFRGFRLNE